MEKTEENINFETARMLSLYAAGTPAGEIADRCGYESPCTVYKKLAEHPHEYNEAKRKLRKKKTAKYRRAGSLAIDLQLKYLEEFPADDPERLALEIKKIAELGEKAEHRADLRGGDPTEIHKTINTVLTVEDVKKHIQEVENAGTGLDIESVQ